MSLVDACDASNRLRLSSGALRWANAPKWNCWSIPKSPLYKLLKRRGKSLQTDEFSRVGIGCKPNRYSYNLPSRFALESLPSTPGSPYEVSPNRYPYNLAIKSLPPPLTTRTSVLTSSFQLQQHLQHFNN